MAQTQGQRRASQAVEAWMAHHERNTAWLARITGADPGTIGDFLNGKRWPKYVTQGRIEKALGWPAGTLTTVADGAAAPPTQLSEGFSGEGTLSTGSALSVGGFTQDDGERENELLFRRPEGLNDQEWERVKSESREYIEWQIERASRER